MRLKPSRCEKHQNWKYIRFCPVCRMEDHIKKLEDALKDIEIMNKTLPSTGAEDFEIRNKMEDRAMEALKQ